MRVLWGSALATLEPGQDTFVNYDNDDRAPLFISGGEDHLMPPSVQLQRQALQVQHRDRGQAHSPISPPPARSERLGADRGRRAVLKAMEHAR